jgi:hypothetical protein
VAAAELLQQMQQHVGLFSRQLFQFYEITVTLRLYFTEVLAVTNCYDVD